MSMSSRRRLSGSRLNNPVANLAAALTVSRATAESERAGLVELYRDVYAREKDWLQEPGAILPEACLADASKDWLVARIDGAVAGALCVDYAPPPVRYLLEQDLGVTGYPGTDALLAAGSAADLGNFAIARPYRRSPLVVLALIREAIARAIARDTRHFLTVVFMGESTSPYAFHCNSIGFSPLGTRSTGPYHTSCQRSILWLDIHAAYHRLRKDQPRLFSRLTSCWTPEMHARFGGAGSLTGCDR